MCDACVSVVLTNTHTSTHNLRGITCFFIPITEFYDESEIDFPFIPKTVKSHTAPCYRKKFESILCVVMLGGEMFVVCVFCCPARYRTSNIMDYRSFLGNNTSFNRHIKQYVLIKKTTI